MNKKTYKIYLADNTNDYLVDEICDLFDGADYWYANKYIKYHGSGEGLETLKRTLTRNGIKIKS